MAKNFFDEEILKQSCDKYNFTYHITANEVIVKTVYASWKFDYTENPFHLYHRPTVLHYYKTSINTNEGYHDQKRSFKKIEDLIDYIQTHDNNFNTKKKPALKKKR